MGDLNLDYPDLLYQGGQNMSREGAAGFNTPSDPREFARPYEISDFPVNHGRELIRPYDYPNTSVYRGRVIRPLDVPSSNPYSEDSAPQDSGQYLIIIFSLIDLFI